ncbi:NADH dehydrogenase [ubiquinone] 1 beta subcomplex subunit 7 [Copidosoma floridanum]|uniref:NADH dehydrogenase [ubiquinone] 1 beta subcomplex subunit 7 n=1 Tax=Copidosoma floridanum TaxID=29053 RepID=UPI0006C96521|nr:NADH dehydrogenase [ubiquinone] 1 beta subcomplex subunit 7 [Copidosoma floridanum]
MGNMVVRTWDNFWEPELQPVPYGPTTFDPNFGFNGERKERVMIATEQELRAAKIPKEKWDYCAHLLLEVERCRADNFPFVWNCKPQAHDVSNCYYDDYVLRMKEFERERRLRHRAARLAEKAQAA